jgi:ketosteroid isomerase-like protein
MDSAKTHQIVADWFSAMGRFDWGPVMDTMSDDVVFTIDPQPYTKVIPYTGRWVGKGAFMEASQIRNETSQLSGLDVRGIVAEGNTAVARITSKATVIKTGVYFELDIVQWIELNDEGKIVKVDAIFDPVPEMNAFVPGLVPGA